MGDNRTETTTQQSGLSNPAMNAAATTIGNQLNSALSGGVRADTTNRVPALSGQTMQGIAGLTSNPANSIFSGAMGNTIGEFGAIASGQRMGENDAAWNAAKDNVIADTNSAFNASGRFGGGSNVESVAQGLGGVELSRIASNEARQMSAANMLPSLYSGSMLPASAFLQAGQVMDANAAARAQEDARIWDATNNANWNTLQRGGSIFAGTAPVSGTTTTGTQTTQVPWWQSALGVGAGLASFL